MSFVTPSITHNKPAALSSSAMFTHSRKLLVVQNRTRLRSVCIVSHTDRNTKRESSLRCTLSLALCVVRWANNCLPSVYLGLGSQKFLQCLRVTYPSIKGCFIIIWQTTKCTFFNMFSHILLFHCFTVHFDSLSFIHTNSCTFSYNYVSVF